MSHPVGLAVRHALVPVFLLLLGCGEVAEDGCAPFHAGDTTGAALTARIDGRRFVAPTYAGDLPGYYRTTDSLLLIGANAYHGGEYEQVGVVIRPFQGPGAYPVGGYTGPQGAVGFYYCSASPWGFFYSEAEPADTVFITTFDTAGARVAGSFSFRVVEYHSGAPERRITDGHFDLGLSVSTPTTTRPRP